MQRTLKTLRLLVAALTMAIALAGCSAPAVETDAQVAVGLPVEVEQVKKSTITNELTYIGQVAPQMRISVLSKLTAEVKSVNFDVGDTVQEGDVLFTVDAKDIQNQIRALQAAEAQTQVAVDQAKYGLQVAQEGSKQDRLNELQYESSIQSARYGAYGTKNAELSKEAAKDAVDEAEYYMEQCEYALQAETAYLQSLLAIGVGGFTESGEEVTQAMIDEQRKIVAQASSNLSAAESAYQKAKKGLSSARISEGQADVSLDMAFDTYDAYKEAADQGKQRSEKNAEFGVMNAQAAQANTQVQLSIAQQTLGDTAVKSPISGVISDRSLEVGQLISPTALPFTIIKMDTVLVEVSVSEALINSIQPGDTVKAVIQSVREEPFVGTVTAVSPAAGQNSTYPVRIELDNKDGLIKPGMFSQVTFVQSRIDNAFVVDKSVIQRDETNQFVYVVVDGRAKKMVVTTGLVGATTIEITSGVSMGDQIVVVGQDYLHDGVDINVVKKDGQAVEPTAPPASQQSADAGDAAFQEEQADAEAKEPDIQADEEVDADASAS